MSNAPRVSVKEDHPDPVLTATGPMSPMLFQFHASQVSFWMFGPAMAISQYWCPAPTGISGLKAVVFSSGFERRITLVPDETGICFGGIDVLENFQESGFQPKRLRPL